MSITNIGKHGMFAAPDCPYSATSIEAVKEMQYLEGEDCDGLAEVLMDALRNKHQ